MEKLLIVDDSKTFLNDVQVLLSGSYSIITAQNAQTGLDILQKERVSAVLLDLDLPDMYGTDVLKYIHSEIDPYLPVIVVTDHDDVQNVVEAMRFGAYDFVPKNFNLEVLGEKVKKALERRQLQLSMNALQNEYIEKPHQFVFASDAMKKVHFEITRLSRLNIDVLLVGETGVGKDLIASQIHFRSNRSDKPFIPVSIRSLSDTLIESELFGHEKGAFSGADKSKVGKFEAANGGTVYIPEISSLNEAVQLKLLHFMQYKTITRVGQDPTKSEIKLDVRLIMATNDDLGELMRTGKMREDFYHRITGITLNIPPLRKRGDDIKPLADYFIQKFSHLHPAGTCRLDPGVYTMLLEYHWPGNVREFANVMKSAIVYAESDVIGPKNFSRLLEPSAGSESLPAGMLNMHNGNLPTYRDIEQQTKEAYFKKVWNESGQDVKKTAEIAGITPQATRRILKSLGLR